MRSLFSLCRKNWRLQCSYHHHPLLTLSFSFKWYGLTASTSIHHKQLYTVKEMSVPCSSRIGDIHYWDIILINRPGPIGGHIDPSRISNFKSHSLFLLR